MRTAITMPESPTEKPGSSSTIRQQLLLELESGAMNCRDLSQTLHQSEKEILDHLQHVRLSLRQQGKKLIITPSMCRKCNYVFEHRTRLGKPGKCPSCRHTGIEPPLFSIAPR
jgi:predicted Zn-ribbon and HTH transcriptional regulator